MKKITPYILLAVIVFTITISPIGVGTAHAAGFMDSVSSAWSSFWGGVANIGGKAFAVLADTLFGNIARAIAWMLFTLSGWFLTVTGYLLDSSIALSIDSDRLRSIAAIETGWKVVRDVANITFIFMLLYIAIATILNLGNYKKALITLVIAALLVNFSLFFTKVVIDASNILAVEFYQKASSVTIKGTQYESISSVLMKGLKLESILSVKDISKVSNFDVAKAYILGSVAIIIAGFVFISMAIMFIIRIVFLIFLMILSPLAFAAMALPGTQGQAKKWWKNLIEQSFFAPVALFFLYITTEILSSGNLLTITNSPANANFADAFSMKNVDDFSLLLVYIIIIGLLLGSLIAAKSISGSVASMAMKYSGGGAAMKYGRGAAMKYGKKLRGAVGVQTRGRLAHYASNKIAGTEFARKHTGLGRFAVENLDKAGGTKYGKYVKEQTKKKTAYGATITGETEDEKNIRKEKEAPIRERGATAKTELSKAQARSKTAQSQTAYTAENEKEKIIAQDLLNIAQKKVEVEKEALEAVKNTSRITEESRREQYATSIMPSSRLGKIAQRISGQDKINREVASKVKANEKGEDSPEEKLMKMIKESVKKEMKEGGEK